MNPVFRDLAISLVQKGLIMLGTWAVTQNLIDGNQATALIGLAPILVGAGWGLWSKWQARKVTIAAKKADVDVAVVKAMSMSAVKAADAPGQTPGA